MLGVGSAYFYRVNRQPAKDVRTLMSWPVSVICLQDTHHAAKLINASLGKDYQIYAENNTMILVREGIKVNSLIEEPMFKGVVVNNIAIVNISLNSDSFNQDNQSLLKESKESYSEIKSSIKRLLSNHKAVVVCGNLELFESFSPGIFTKKNPTKLFNSLNMNFYREGNNYIAWSGVQGIECKSISSKELGSNDDWISVDIV